MKNNIIIRITATLVSLCLLATATGCEKFLTRDAPNQTTDENWWKTKEQLNTVVLECYEPMNPGIIKTISLPWNNGSKVDYKQGFLLPVVENEGLSDNGITCANYIQNTPFTSGTLASNNTNVTYFWQGRYAVIRLCSRFLEYKNQAIFDPDRQPHEGIQTIDRWTGEVRALRAYYHMNLLMNFGGIPIVDHIITPGESNLERDSFDDCVDWIASEFEEASKTLPVEPQTANERWRWTKGACYAYLSYLYLFAHDYEKTVEWANKVIGLNKYDIYVSATNPANSYYTMFLEEAYTANTKESILTRDEGCQQTYRLLPPGLKNGGTGVAPTSSLVDAYELADGRTIDELTPEEQLQLHINPKSMPRDPRLEMTVLFPRETFLGYTNDPWTYDPGNLDYINNRNSTKTGYWIKKWVSDQTLVNPNRGTLPFQLMRYATVLLNYVEAQIELGNVTDPNIYTYLNKIRSRAGQPDVDKSKYNTQATLRTLVRRERRVELAFEGYRLNDIRRWNIGESVMNGTVYGAKLPDAEALYEAESRKFNPARDNVWPIPSNELSQNTNMKQNPGY